MSYYLCDFFDGLHSWKIEETLGQLIDLAKKKQISLAPVYQIKNIKKQKEWLAKKLLLQRVLKDYTLLKDAQGKPALVKPKMFCSITHNEFWVYVFMSNTIECGIDIECIDVKAEKIQHKFLHASENFFVDSLALSNPQYYTLLWTIKEASMKFVGKKIYNFKDEINIKKIKLISENFFISSISIAQGKHPIMVNSYLLEKKYCLSLAYSALSSGRIEDTNII